ncbi:MAG TPA: methyl-accepting chemotaxis protein [Candidatus Cloacimonadota bacterium]|nr:methyl-accepting chemotaxis protein [Candidatus Cloacimonadota bacterium]
MKNTSIRNKMIRYFSLAVFCIFIVFVSYVILQVYKFQVNQAYQNVEELSQRHAKQIELDFSKRFSFLESMKYSIESGVIKDRAQGISYIKQLAQSNKEFQGIYMLYDPDTFDGKDESFKGQINMASNESGHYNPWWYFDNGQIIFGESTSDYFDEEYYALTKQENKNLLIEPYIDEDIKLLMASFTYPLNKNGQFIGIVGGDVTLAFLDEMISQIKILKSGYAFLLSKEGTFVSFPNKEMIGKQTLEAYSKENNRPKLLSIAEDIKNGKEGILEAKDPFSKKASVFVYKQIGNTGWSIISVIPKNEILENVYALIIGMSIIGLISLIVFIYIAKRIAESITKPILKMTGILEEISQGQGDLTVQIDVNSNDELGKMAHYFNQFVMNLRKIMQEFMNKNQVISHQSTQLNESAGLLTEQSDSIHTDVEQLSNVSEVVMAEVFTIKSAVEQAESNIGSLAEEMLMLNQDVNTVNEASVSTDQLVKKAGQDLNTVSLNIQEIALSVNNLSDEMKSSSAAISEMNSSISEVAQNALSADKISSEAKAYSNDAQKLRLTVMMLSQQ